MRSRYPDLENLPDDLKTDVEVIVREEFHEIRGQRQGQYVADYNGYKLVVDGMANPHGNQGVEDGAKLLLQPLFTPNGHVVFCKVQDVLADRGGEHPLVAHLNRSKGKRITVQMVRGSKRVLLEGKIACASVKLERERSNYGGRTSISIREELTIESSDGQKLSIAPLQRRWQSGMYGRSNLKAYHGTEEVYVVCWEK